MAKEWAKKFYNSKQWRLCRESLITSVNGYCQRCLTRNKLTPGYIVHHIIHLSPSNIDDPNISLSHDNLEYVCKDCHEAKHHGEHEVLREGLMFTEDGDIVQVN